MWLVIAAAVALAAQEHAHPTPPAAAPLLDVAKRPIALAAGIGSAHDSIGTTSKEARAFYDQGLAFLHSYWWLEAARSFNQALAHDPTLAIAHAQLSIAYTELNAAAAARESLARAQAREARASDHDRRHIAARVAQAAAETAGAWTSDAQRTLRASLDEALAKYPSDE